MSTPSQGGVSGWRTLPIVRFLGEDEARGGPFALLGLSPAQCTEELILGALDRQLERIGEHAEAETPEADEVRLALHAAAAQLLDPNVRRHLIARWMGLAAPTGTVAAPAPSRRSPQELLLEQDALLTLALMGGWNSRSLRRLAALARARGLGPAHVARALRGLGKRRRGRGRAGRRDAGPVRRDMGAIAPPTSGAARAVARAMGVPEDWKAPLPEQVDPGTESLKKALIIGGAAVLLLVFSLSIIIYAISGESDAPPSPPPVPAPVTPAQTGSAVKDEDFTSPAKVDLSGRDRGGAQVADLAAAVRVIADGSAALQVDPEQAVARFERAVATVAGQWGALPKDRLVASRDAIVEFVYHAGSTPESSRRALVAVGSAGGTLPEDIGGGLSANQVWPAVWVAGMLTRLSREQDLSASASEYIDARLVGLLGAGRAILEPSFEAGATAMLMAVPRLITPAVAKDQDAQARVDTAAWGRWTDAVEVLLPEGAPARHRVLLSGMETMMLRGPEPDLNRGSLDVITTIAARITWRPGDESRTWLLRWFDDRAVSGPDLFAVTSALATKSSAEGVDTTMVLPGASTDASRADLRTRYARVWGIQEQVQRDELVADWLRVAKDHAAASAAAGTLAADMGSAVVLSRLSEAAALIWRGQSGAAADIVYEPARLVEDLLQATGPAGSPGMDTAIIRGGGLGAGAGGDGAWAERYLAARRNIPVRGELLEQIKRGTQIGPVDAEVLALEAVMGSPDEIRIEAQAICKQFIDSPAMVNAVLELLPRMGRFVSNGRLVEALGQKQLPGIKDPSWPIAARRALVERLLELVAGEGELALLDRLSVLLAVSYRARASETALSSEERAAAAQPPAHSSAGAIWARWRESAAAMVPGQWAGLRLDEIERRRAGRLSLARGPVETFAAEQTSLCELMAYVIASEKPSSAERARAAMTNLAERRREAKNIVEQIKGTERTMIELWLARLEEPEPTP